MSVKFICKTLNKRENSLLWKDLGNWFGLEIYLNRSIISLNKWKKRENSAEKWWDLWLKVHKHTETYTFDTFTLFWSKRHLWSPKYLKFPCVYVCVLSTRDLITFLVSFLFLSIYWVICTSVHSFPRDITKYIFFNRYFRKYSLK